MDKVDRLRTKVRAKVSELEYVLNNTNDVNLQARLRGRMDAFNWMLWEGCKE